MSTRHGEDPLGIAEGESVASRMGRGNTDRRVLLMLSDAPEKFRLLAEFLQSRGAASGIDVDEMTADLTRWANVIEGVPKLGMSPPKSKS